MLPLKLPVVKQSGKKIKKEKTVVPSSKWIPDTLFRVIQKNTPIPCIDLLPIRKAKNKKIEVLLIKRKIYPEQGKWVLIGGRILKGELTKETIRRQAKEELGVSVKILSPWNEIAPFAVFNDPKADKQKHFVVLTFPVMITKGKIKTTGPEFSSTKWFSLHKLPKRLGFHHKKTLATLIHYNTTHSLLS